jgi:hypothetical protein
MVLRALGAAQIWSIQGSPFAPKLRSSATAPEAGGDSAVHRTECEFRRHRIDNLQALCKACHQDKTANEHEQGQYVKFSDTESCFNNTVQEIMNSALSHAYAFVEPIREPSARALSANLSATERLSHVHAAQEAYLRCKRRAY